MLQTDLFLRFGAALGIGFLIGLQREYSHPAPQKDTIAGVRTFALLSLAGCTAALLADQLASPWVFVGAVLGIAALLTVSYYVAARRNDIGLTTEVAALVTTLAGGLCYWGYAPLAGALAVTTTLLLALKLQLHSFAHRLTPEDVYATLRFAVITVIILPLLPNQPLGPPPFDVLNPFKIWLMVALISGISFLGYIAIKLVGTQRGIGLTGFLGGLVSSTAVTLTFTARSQTESALERPFALAILVAWTTMFARVLLEVAALNRQLLMVIALPLVVTMLAALVYCAYLFLSQGERGKGQVTLANPFGLRSALQFGALYAGILLVSRAAQLYLGSAGLYLSSVLAGLTDVDAITLSMSELSASGSVDVATAARAIVLAAAANTAVKGMIVLGSGSPGVRRLVLPGLALIVVSGLMMVIGL